MGVANFRSIANYQFKFQRGYYPIRLKMRSICLFWTKSTSNHDQNWPRRFSIVKKGPLCVKSSHYYFSFFCAKALGAQSNLSIAELKTHNVTELRSQSATIFFQCEVELGEVFMILILAIKQILYGSGMCF